MTTQRPIYWQADLLRDVTLGGYIFYQLTGGLQRLILGASTGFGGGSVLNQAVTVLMLGVAIICVLYQRIPLRRVLRGAGPFIIPIILIMVSVAWSDYVSIGGRRIIRFCLELVGLVLLVSCYRDSRSFLRTLWITFAILVVLDFLALAVPRMSMTSIGYAGVHGHKNTLGSFAYAAIPLFLIAWRARLMGRWSILSLGLGLITMPLLAISLSKTATALVPFCGVLAYIGYHVWRRGLTTQLALGGLFAALVLVFALPLSQTGGVNLAEAIGAFTGDPTMTGRTGVWEYTFWRVGDRYMTGVGYGSFWDVDASTVAVMNQFGVTFAFNQSHNGYIGVYAELGLLGIGAIIIMWIMATTATLRRVGNAAEWPLVGYGLFIALGYTFYNVTETSFFRVGFDTWVMYVLVSLAVPKLVARTPSAPRARSRPRPVRRSYAPRRRRPAPTPTAPRLSGRFS